MWRAAIVIAAGLAWGGVTLAQGGANTGVELPAVTAPENPTLRTTGERVWVLSLRWRAFSEDFHDGEIDRLGVTPGSPGRTPGVIGRDDLFDLERAVVALPLPGATATHAPVDEQVRGSLRFDDFVADREVEIVPGYQSGERLALLHAEGVRGAEDLEAWLDVPMTSRSVDFDEGRAREIGWPEGPWPALAASALLPQLGVDPSNERVRALVERAVGAKPYSDPPALVAKKIAAAVINGFQPSGLGFEYDRAGRFAGLAVGFENETASEMKGSPADMAALYCAALRAAGLPARLVVGYDLLASPEGREESIAYLPAHCGTRFREGDSLALPRLSYWVEFALYDEGAGPEDGTLEWIPVDVAAQRGVSSRAHPLDQRWLFFGNHSCSEALLPISHHFFPPTTVVGMGAPLMWGWIATPETPLLSQTLRVWGRGAALTLPEGE